MAETTHTIVGTERAWAGRVKTAFAVCTLAAAVFTALAWPLSPIGWVLAFIAVFVPSTVFFVINFYCFKDMATMISSTGAEDAGIRDENKKPEDDEPLDFSALDLDERKDDDEYLFFNGKMMKRKTLRKMKEEQEKKEP